MSLLLPEAGLVFWMLIAFGIVFFVLRKYGFPAIISMIDERKKFIDEALLNAKEANKRLADIEEQSKVMLNNAKEEQARILKEAAATREQLIKEARTKAESEGEKMIAESRRIIEQEKEDALAAIRTQVAELSLAIAEKIIRSELSKDEAQQTYMSNLVDEVIAENKGKK
jgi:F-type H+-transporting ATPase subunit b